MKKRGQVWIETVVYTLIAFVILGAVLSFAKPKIEELQDKSIIEQSLEILEKVDGIIEEIKTVEGNKREIELGIKKGSLTIDSIKEQIVFEIESRHMYSEPCPPEACIPYEKGDIIIYTNQIGDMYKINATMNYTGKYNITWSDSEKSELLSQSPNPYQVFISNKGGNPTQINFEFV